MAYSRRYTQLVKRLGDIESLFLPKIKLSGNYTKKEQDFTRAYLLLAHAEIEAYFEEVSEKKAKDAYAKWQATRTKSNVLLSLTSFDEAHINDKDIGNRVNKTLSRYIHALRQNHGIKEKNILSILLPIGIEDSEIDRTWLNTIDSFGATRGEIAHTSARVQQPIDPATLKTTINQILSEISILDEKIKRLK